MRLISIHIFHFINIQIDSFTSNFNKIFQIFLKLFFDWKYQRTYQWSMFLLIHALCALARVRNSQSAPNIHLLAPNRHCTLSQIGVLAVWIKNSLMNDVFLAYWIKIILDAYHKLIVCFCIPLSHILPIRVFQYL